MPGEDDAGHLILKNISERTEKTTLEEWGGLYVGVRAAPAPPHLPVLFSRLAFFQWSHLWLNIEIRHLFVELPAGNHILLQGFKQFLGTLRVRLAQ